MLSQYYSHVLLFKKIDIIVIIIFNTFIILLSFQSGRSPSGTERKVPAHLPT